MLERVAKRDLSALSLYSGFPKCDGWRFRPLKQLGTYLWFLDKESTDWFK
jgi:hypothetical protein